MTLTQQDGGTIATSFSNPQGTTTPSNTQTFTNKSGNISQWTNDSGYTSNTGDITGVTAGSGMSGGGTSGSVTLTNADKGSSQSIYKNFAASSGGTATANSNNDTLTIAAGTNVTTVRSGDTITINATTDGQGVTSVATTGAILGGTITTTGTISHSTAAGYKHIPSGGALGQVLGWSGTSGTAVWTTPSSGGTISGSIANEQIAVGTAANTIGGESYFTWSPQNGFVVGDNSQGGGANNITINRPSSSPGKYIIKQGTTTEFSITTGGNTTIDTDTNDLIISTNSSANVGIGNTSPSHKLDVTGTGRFTSTVTATNFILSSDERLKENIKDLEPKHIDPNWKSFNIKDSNEGYRVGVIAQELEVNHPEFVETDVDGYKSVKYIDLLISKIAELEERIKKLEK